LRQRTEREEAKQVLAGTGWLSLLPETSSNEILSKTTLRKFRKNEAVYALHDPPAGMYGLVSGSLGIVMHSNTGDPLFVHTALPGFWFGEAAAISGEARRIGVTARSDVAALYLPLPAIKEMVRGDPSLWQYIALNAVLNLDLALRALHDARLRDPFARVSAILLRLAGYETPQFAADTPCRVDINQTELADLAGLSRTVVSQILLRLSSAALVSVGYGYIDLLRPGVFAEQVADHLGK
jgi:CRP-like cAMP-binding protein